MVRSLNEFDAEASPIAGTEIGYDPFYSPNGQWLGFMVTETPRSIKKVRATGGTPTMICVRPGGGTGASWGEDGTIVFGANSTGLWRVDASGGEPEEITTVDEANGAIGHVLPSYLPGGKHVLYTVWTGTASTSFVAILSLESLESMKLLESGMGARYVPTGHIVYGHQGTLQAVAFDLETLAVHGAPVSLVGDVAWGDAAFQGPQFAISSAGALAYVQGTLQRQRNVLVWIDRAGEVERLPFEEPNVGIPSVSPDGLRLAVSVRKEETGNIWIYDLSGRAPFPVTFGENSFYHPLWTADAGQLVYASWSKRSLHRGGAAPGTGEPEELYRKENAMRMNFNADSLSADGQMAIVTIENRESGYDIMAIPLAGGEPLPVVQTPSNEYSGQVSPDGNWLAYSSDLTGRPEIWVRPYPESTAGAILPLTSSGGTSPVWSRDGAELYYLDPNLRSMRAISVPQTEDEEWGRAESLFRHPPLDTRNWHNERQFDVAPDGRFIFAVPEKGLQGGENPFAELPSPQIHVVTGWFEELKRLVPTGEAASN
jgi:serine/threonine-protein kinase